MNKLVFASVISEIQQSEIFMTVKSRICEAPAANLNGVRVTEAFIDDIVDNQEQYVGLPLYADVRSLTSGNYRRLGHLYDARTGEFHSTQIGSFYQFDKEKTDDGCALIGYARIAKRNKKLSKAICELFADGALKFSFELSVGDWEDLDDGTIQIDVSESNYLEGTAIVTFPACEDAVALEFVAQHEADDSTEGGETEMAEKDNVLQETTAEETVETAEEKIAEETVTAEETQAEEAAETPAAESSEEQVNAAVIVHETDRSDKNVCAYDTETGTEVCQRIAVETTVSHVEQESSIVEAEDGIHIAEADGDPEDSGDDTPGEDTSGDDTPGSDTPGSDTPGDDTPGDDSGSNEETTEEDLPAPDSTESKKTAEQLIAELAETVEMLKNEIAELKTQKAVAEATLVTAEINPMMADINSSPSYGLLEKEDKPAPSYSLLSR